MDERPHIQTTLCIRFELLSQFTAETTLRNGWLYKIHPATGCTLCLCVNALEYEAELRLRMYTICFLLRKFKLSRLAFLIGPCVCCGEKNISFRFMHMRYGGPQSHFNHAQSTS